MSRDTQDRIIMNNMIQRRRSEEAYKKSPEGIAHALKIKEQAARLKLQKPRLF